MFNFLPTWIVLQNSNKALHDSQKESTRYDNDKEDNVRFTKGEQIFLYTLFGILITIAVAMVIFLVIVGVVLIT